MWQSGRLKSKLLGLRGSGRGGAGNGGAGWAGGACVLELQPVAAGLKAVEQNFDYHEY